MLDRTAAGFNLRTSEGRAGFVDAALPILDRIPDRTRQELFVKEVSSRAGVSEDAIWPRAKKAVTTHGSSPSSSQLASLSQVTKAEKGLIWLLIHDPGQALDALAELDPADFEGLASGSVLDLARKLNNDKRFSPSVLPERLSMPMPKIGRHASEAKLWHDASECARFIRRRRWERERSAVPAKRSAAAAARWSAVNETGQSDAENGLVDVRGHELNVGRRRGTTLSIENDTRSTTLIRSARRRDSGTTR